ncbi:MULTISPECIES: hypothetical protein [Photorhabdus]|nr:MULTISPECIES: hypothetical protein [Photorhabdus]NDK96041.1 hypothetical protein [Photorhabdus laumondii subsp. laumondii]NDL49846.1 hypothetical protein [Photorhabdus laumondii subsp. laumondii]
MQTYSIFLIKCLIYPTARKRIPGSIANYVTGVNECSQQRSNLKDDGYTC